ncbi:TPA: AlpA family phage regulatory protein [Vibrio vulnificus]|nr:AlpA family phage regulatory protein [Vibrio vulnificus]
MPNRIISLEEVSNLVGRHPRTIWRWWAKEDGFPRPLLRNGRCIGWRQSDIDSWMDESVVTKNCKEMIYDAI